VADLVYYSLLPEHEVPPLMQRLPDQAVKTFVTFPLDIFMFEMLHKSGHPHTSQDSVIKATSADLDDTYDKILKQIPYARRQEMTIFFQLVIAASELLTISKMDLLLAIRPDLEIDPEISEILTNANVEVEGSPFLGTINEKICSLRL
jgi:hypothetical protein